MAWIERKKDWIKPERKAAPSPAVLPIEDNEPTEHGVTWRPVRCPLCNSKKCPVYKSAPPVRYHKCECGHDFKSIEE